MGTQLNQTSNSAIPSVANGILVNDSEDASKSSYTIFTSSATARTFLTGYQVSWVSNVTADNISSQVTATFVNGGSNAFVRMVKPTLTATNNNIQLNFDIPMEITKNSPLLFTNSFTVGASTYQIIVYGYTI